MDQPTNQPTIPQVDITEMCRKAIGAERAGILAYLRSHADMQVRELADAIEAGVHLNMR
jgi:hypothetical protein